MPATEGARTWLLIVDPSLKSLEGHSYNYDLSVANAARACFDQVVIYADKDLPPSAAAPAGIKPIPSSAILRGLQILVNRAFSPFRPTKKSPGLEKNAIAADHVSGNVHFGFLRLLKNMQAANISISLKRILASLPFSATDQVHILLQSAGIREIAGVDSFAARFGQSMTVSLTFHIVLRSDIDIVRTRSESEQMFQSRLIRMALTDEPLIRFYTDSDALAARYREFIGMNDQFVVLPIPISAKPSHLAARPTRDARSIVRVSMLGPSRIEKGFGQLKDFIQNLPPRLGEARVHLAIQVTRDSPDPRVRHVISWLEDYSRDLTKLNPVLELLNGPAEEDVYYSWFALTDILIAPYLLPRYKASTSGVFVEALHFRVPTVTLGGTWVADKIIQAASQGLKIGEVAEVITEFPGLLASIYMDLPKYRSDIGVFLQDWPQSGNANRLVRILLGDAD